MIDGYLCTMAEVGEGYGLIIRDNERVSSAATIEQASCLFKSCGVDGGNISL